MAFCFLCGDFARRGRGDFAYLVGVLMAAVDMWRVGSKRRIASKLWVLYSGAVQGFETYKEDW